MNLLKKIYSWRLHHVLFWAAFFVVWIALRIDDYPNLTPTVLAGLLKVLSLAGAVYFTNYVLIPKYLYTKRYVAFFFSFAALVAVTGFIVIKVLNLILSPYASTITHWPNATLNAQLYDVYIPLFFMVGAAAGIKFYIDQLRTLHRLQSALRAGAENELQFLRSQINPHSLFNSLNTIYFLIDKENRTARDTLMQFSELLRYQLYECNTEQVDIGKEIQYLRSYVAIQKLRHGEQYDIVFRHAPDVKDFSIAPLLLVPFVENAFKHVSHHAANSIHIDMERSDGAFRFRVRNTCEPKPAAGNGGIGLANVKRRLELLYNGRHSLEIQPGPTDYSITLTLQV
ncbi:sensor histidine kinase [Chitinophaga sp. GCM10012297]|uniref:Histidine kinase n=1 Tax=Chitinophaga chungangae TaxID=2821488 RepID=A0ABS3YHV6_9BACT|nr:histidine kinase [Chitinophaga chungangae]MBO9154252.1 histidine kinase [Chitinophaga chungangae]